MPTLLALRVKDWTKESGMYALIGDYLPVLEWALILTNTVVAILVIFLERKDPAATLAWVMILFFLPVIGIFFYIMLSNSIIRKKAMKLTVEEEIFIHDSLVSQMKEIGEGNFQFNGPKTKNWRDLLRLHQILANAYYTQDNEIQVITDGNEMFELLLKDIKEAKNTISIVYFIIKPDEIGRRFLKTLSDKAAEGVEVRLLGDGLGCRALTKTVLKEFRRSGGRFAFFLPLRFRYLSPRLNYRNHRKLVIIDDTIGYLGGFNIGREYLGRKKKFGYWRDTQLRILGSAVQDINARFLLDWRTVVKEDLTLKDAYFSETIGHGTTGIQVVSSGPDTGKEEVKRGFNRMISTAEEKIWIQTPYFVPSNSLHENLKVAIMSGVDVRIMIPNKPDHMFVYWATWSYVGDLIELGAKVYIYDAGFLHAKTIVVDGEISSVGTANFDRRSFKLSFETNVFIYGAKQAEKMERIFEEDMLKCYQLTKESYRKRNLLIKIKEPVCRLLSDIL